jgi:hypothetical protein
VLLGVSGGLMPSPAAFLVLLTGIFSDRVGLALVLVLGFGAGMAGVLTVIGLATLGGRNLLAGAATHGILQGAARVGPVLAAWGVLVAGGVLTLVACAAVLPVV